MSIEKFKALVPWPADMPIDVGSMSLAATNATNLLKYWHPPLFNFTWAADNTPPEVAFDSRITGHDNLQLLVPPVAGYRSNPYRSLRGRFWYVKHTDLEVYFRIHMVRGHQWPTEILEGEVIKVHLKTTYTGDWEAITLTEVMPAAGDEHEPITWWATVERLTTSIDESFVLKALGLFWVAS
jgi:hypothetical protein